MIPATQRFASRAQWLAAADRAAAGAASTAVDAAVDAAVDEGAFLATLPQTGIDGWCSVCAGRRRFIAPELALGLPVSLRESLHCRACASNARQRACAALLLDAMGRRDRVYVTEQASAFHLQLHRRIGALVGSEFIGGDALQSLRQRVALSRWLSQSTGLHWLRREDVTALSFADAAFDAVLSLDVLEHVPDHARALREFARVLRRGGQLLLTVPFFTDRAASEVLATVQADGSIAHLRQPPEYHGDPLGSPVLCFHHFAWDLLDDLRAAGFAQAQMLRVQGLACAIPAPIWVVHATR